MLYFKWFQNVNLKYFQVFFEYCRKSYKVFLDGADEFTEERDEMERKLGEINKTELN